MLGGDARRRTDGSTRVGKGGRAASSTLLPMGANWNVWISIIILFFKASLT